MNLKKILFEQYDFESDKLKRIKLLEEDKIFYTCSALNSGILDINFTITYKYKTFDDLQ